MMVSARTWGAPATASGSALVISNPVKKERSIDLIATLASGCLVPRRILRLQPFAMFWRYFGPNKRGNQPQDPFRRIDCSSPCEARAFRSRGSSTNLTQPQIFFFAPCRIAARSIVFAMSAAKPPRRLQGAERCNTCC
jgi:hypothetical protein